MVATWQSGIFGWCAAPNSRIFHVQPGFAAAILILNLHPIERRAAMLKRILLSVLALSVVAGAIAFSGNRKAGVGDLQIDIEQRNPWTHLRLNDTEESFHFVVVSDRTGGHRARVFSQAVDQINLLQPAFVI